VESVLPIVFAFDAMCVSFEKWLFSRLIGFNQARGDGIRASTVFSPLHRELPRYPDDPCLSRRMRQSAQRLEAHEAVQRRRVHDDTVAGLPW
jgi:hypothetical protein